MKKQYLLTAIILLLAGGWLLFPSRQSNLVVNILDVGEGDAILIKTPHNHYILVDGGPDRTILRQLGSQLPYGERQIDLVISTHPHSDHLAGLLSVLSKYQVNKIISTGVVHTTQDYLNWLQIINEQNIPLATVKAGEDILVDGVVFKILWPQDSLVGQRVKDLNDTSLVILVSFGGTRLLLAGDISQGVEQKLMETGTDLSAQILKVAHQGSRTSTSLDFLRAVKPEWAVISVGANNRYGHPSPETVVRLDSLSIKTKRTDLDGNITFISDGQKWSLKTASLINW